MAKQYKICSRCVMDTTAADITFTEQGICSFCSEFIERSDHILNKSPNQRRNELDTLVAKVKND